LSLLVPLRRKTIGLVNLFYLLASIIDAANESHLKMPPKMFTKIACTSVSLLSNFNASVRAYP
jgi:hypothetical protein